MGKQNLDEKKKYLRELSRSKFHSVTSSHVILYNDVKNSYNVHQKRILSGFGNELFNNLLTLQFFIFILRTIIYYRETQFYFSLFESNVNSSEYNQTWLQYSG